jgi:4-diphosphocytidyl-2-C-methyl-D-erythritol kinase
VNLETLAAQAPAKINRELRVGSLWPDGFHEIRSRLVSIDLADRIEVAPGRGMGVELSCEGISAGKDPSNLVVRAARALAEKVGRAADVRIHLEKRIPVGAGLGGGSSDAARTLALLARLWEVPLATEELARIGAALGSDVSYFFLGGEAEIAGRGERVTPLLDSASRELLLLTPPFRLSTRDVYSVHRRLASGSDGGGIPTALDIETSGKFFGRNDLAFAVLQMSLEMSVLLDSARELAAEAAITGSGSSIVLEGASPDAVERLAAKHPRARLQRCRTLPREEYRVRTEPSGGSQWRSPR